MSVEWARNGFWGDCGAIGGGGEVFDTLRFLGHLGIKKDRRRKRTVMRARWSCVKSCDEPSAKCSVAATVTAVG